MKYICISHTVIRPVGDEARGTQSTISNGQANYLARINIRIVVVTIETYQSKSYCISLTVARLAWEGHDL